MSVSKNVKIPPTPNLKFALPSKRNLNASQLVEHRWSWVPKAKFRVGHVHFILFVSISFALGILCEHHFQWIMG